MTQNAFSIIYQYVSLQMTDVVTRKQKIDKKQTNRIKIKAFENVEEFQLLSTRADIKTIKEFVKKKILNSTFVSHFFERRIAVLALQELN